jgi:hypothetical protein
MIPILSLTRPVSRRFRIYREVTDYRGTALIDVPFWGADAMSLHAPDAATAVENAKQLLPTWLCKGLVAVEEAQ